MYDTRKARIAGYAWFGLESEGFVHDADVTQAFGAWAKVNMPDASGEEEDAAYLAFMDGALDWSDEAFDGLTVAQAAEYKQVSPISIRKILGDDARRVAIFPSAYQVLERGQPQWRLAEDELKAWTPIRGRGRKTKGESK